MSDRNSKTTEVTRVYAKYVFLDVVRFSSRTAETQSEIVRRLNEITRSSLKQHQVSDDGSILIPTGDGMCIALLDSQLPYDTHMTLALSILNSINSHNEAVENEDRQFQLRIGINQNTDILVTDINNRRNIAGAGINMAARIMDKADAGQILVSRAVYDELDPSEVYRNKFHHHSATGKHNVQFSAYQFVGEGYSGLATDIPSSFVTTVGEASLTKLAAYYFAHAIKNKSYIVEHCADTAGVVNALGANILLYSLAKDSHGISESTAVHPYQTKTHGYGKSTFDAQVKYYSEAISDIHSQLNLCMLISAQVLRDYADFVISAKMAPTDIFITHEGEKKLKRDWPNIWNELDLDEVCES